MNGFIYRLPFRRNHSELWLIATNILVWRYLQRFLLVNFQSIYFDTSKQDRSKLIWIYDALFLPICLYWDINLRQDFLTIIWFPYRMFKITWQFNSYWSQILQLKYIKDSGQRNRECHILAWVEHLNPNHNNNTE